jgi:hypothetical protein
MREFRRIVAVGASFLSALAVLTLGLGCPENGAVDSGDITTGAEIDGGGPWDGSVAESPDSGDHPSQSTDGGMGGDAPDASAPLSDAGPPWDAGPPLSGLAQFSYESVDGAVCGNGTPAGLGISPGTDPGHLVVLWNGGGACWDDFSCFGLNAAVHLQTTYSEEVMAGDLNALFSSPLLDRGHPQNPVAQAHLAFIPYCTGDLHAGNGTKNYQADLLGLDIRTVHHAGRGNAQVFLEHLAARFPTVQAVTFIGFSAGGYGAMFNVDQGITAFGGIPVHVLMDGSPFIQPSGALWATWQAAWQIEIGGSPPHAISDLTDRPHLIAKRRGHSRLHGLSGGGHHPTGHRPGR